MDLVFIACVITAVVFWFIGFCCGCSANEPFDLAEIERIRRREAECKLAIVEEELRRGCREFRGVHIPYKCPHCYPCYQCYVHNGHLHDHQCKEQRIVEKVIYAKAPGEQEVVDLLMRASVPLEELKTKLGIK